MRENLIMNLWKGRPVGTVDLLRSVDQFRSPHPKVVRNPGVELAARLCQTIPIRPGQDVRYPLEGLVAGPHLGFGKLAQRGSLDVESQLGHGSLPLLNVEDQTNQILHALVQLRFDLFVGFGCHLPRRKWKVSFMSCSSSVGDFASCESESSPLKRFISCYKSFRKWRILPCFVLVLNEIWARLQA